MDIWAFSCALSLYPFDSVRLHPLCLSSPALWLSLGCSSLWLGLGPHDLQCCPDSSILGLHKHQLSLRRYSNLVPPGKSPPWLLPHSTLLWAFILGFLLGIPPYPPPQLHSGSFRCLLCSGSSVCPLCLPCAHLLSPHSPSSVGLCLLFMKLKLPVRNVSLNPQFPKWGTVN